MSHESKPAVPSAGTDNMENRAWLPIAKAAALEAGSAIMQVYDSMNFSVEYKADKSPLTIADTAAHQIIKKKLAVTGIPLLSEEGKLTSFNERQYWDLFWLVDPLDGTKEFIKRNKDFTVNIALVKDRQPVFGIVYAPAMELLYWNDLEGRAWKKQNADLETEISTRHNDKVEAIVASKSHLSKETEEYIKQFPHAKLQTIGSSLKFMLIAEGSADCYPRFGPTMEWDTAAAHAIVEAAGGKVTEYNNNEPLYYNKEDLLNPWFIVRA
jgi:3'(2'), 5'-bisphosphate nucleotidase